MNHDIQNLIHWLHVCVWIAAICSTSFPIIYAFFPWWTTGLGKILMFKAIAGAFALDFTLLFMYWQPADILVEFWIDVIVFGLIAAAAATFTIALLRINYVKRKTGKLKGLSDDPAHPDFGSRSSAS